MWTAIGFIALCLYTVAVIVMMVLVWWNAPKR